MRRKPGRPPNPSEDGALARIVGQEIKHLRSEAGLSQSQLLSRIGRSGEGGGAMANRESGYRSVSLAVLLRVCAVVGASPGDVVNRIAERWYVYQQLGLDSRRSWRVTESAGGTDGSVESDHR